MSTAVRIVVPPSRPERWILLAIVVLALIVSGIAPKDRLTWLLETVWVMIALPIVVLNWRRFPLTRLLCWLLAAGRACAGAHPWRRVHYAETPLGFWLRDVFGFARNPWDRVGHLMQGFVPAVLARELLLRCTPLRRGGWLFYLVLAACLSFSAFFELIEWWSALIYGADADAFLATQGDVWDTQWDMFLCLCGATLSLLVWPRLHDRQLGPNV